MTTIVSLRAENVKRLKAVELKPDASGVFVVGGVNGAGKSSCLDAVEMALNGSRSIPSKPVRKGEDCARIVVELDDLIVTRKFAADGKSQLVVESKDGARYSSGQGVLDKLVGNLSFDPWGFARMKQADQQSVLRELAGIDTAKIDDARKDQYEYRRELNRQVKDLEGQLKGQAFYPDAPAEEVSVTAAMEELKAVQAVNKAYDEAERAVVDLRSEVGNTAAYVKQTADTVASLEKQLAEAMKRHASAIEDANKADEAYAAACMNLSTMERKPTEAIESVIQNADDVNAKVRANRERKATLEKLQAIETKSNNCTAKIEAFDKQKTDLVENADYPIDGLGFDGEGEITYGGIPFEQCSAAEKLRVSIAIGMALNPKLRVILVRDGSLMDDSTLAMVCEMAQTKGYQVWVERVGDDDSCSVVIEDGSVKSVRKRSAKQAEAVASE
jgi:DNA repair exonuclease SbcCD ATPase subunit